MPSFLDKPLCGLDLETSGLHSKKDCILEIALVKRCSPTETPRISLDGASPWIRREIRSHAMWHNFDVFWRRYEPTTPVVAEAAIVNGYDKKNWYGLLHSPSRDMDELQAFCKGTLLTAHGTDFDVSFLREQGFVAPKALIDSRSMATALLCSVGQESPTLDACCRTTGILNASPHTAYFDAVAALELSEKLIHSSAFDRLKWRALLWLRRWRDLGVQG